MNEPSPGIHLQWGTIESFSKCWKVFIVDFFFIILFYDSFFTAASLQNKNVSSGCLKKSNKSGSLAVNDSIEFPNQRIYTAHEKEAITLTYSLENLFRKKITYDRATWKECNTKKVNMKRVRHKKTPWNTVVQYEQRAKGCNMKRMQYKKSVLRKECNMIKEQHEKSTERRKKGK